MDTTTADALTHATLCTKGCCVVHDSISLACPEGLAIVARMFAVSPARDPLGMDFSADPAPIADWTKL